MTSATLQAAFILHHRPFRDTSVIADLITPDHGLLSVIARGARSATSRRRVLLQPFRPLLVSWTGRSELRTLTTVEESGQAVLLTGESLACAYYVTELALRLLSKDEPNIVAFALYARTLAILAQIGNQVEDQTDAPFDASLSDSVRFQICLRKFEVELLHSLGLLPDFAHCDLEKRDIDVSENYRFHPESGNAKNVTSNSATSPLDGAEYEQAQVLDTVPVSGLTLLTLAQRDLNSDDFDPALVLPQAKQLMRQILRVHLGSQPLKSREVFRQLRSFSSPAKTK